MKGDIIEVDYAETNHLDKGFYIKKFYGFITPAQKGGGSALGRNSANPEHEFDENTDMPPFPGYENKAPGKILNGEEIRILRKISVTGLIKKPVSRFTGI